MRIKVLCFILLLNLTSLANTFAKDILPVANKGVLDLRNNSMERSIPLNGEWEFYWKKLIQPTDSLKGTFVPFPVKWNDLSVDGNRLSPFGYATYKLTVLLPPIKENLRVAMPDVYCAYRLFLNGKIVAQNGKVADNDKDFEPHWQYKAFDIPLGVDTANLVLQISNFVHSKGGIKDPIILGKSKALDLARS